MLFLVFFFFLCRLKSETFGKILEIWNHHNIKRRTFLEKQFQGLVLLFLDTGNSLNSTFLDHLNMLGLLEPMSSTVGQKVGCNLDGRVPIFYFYFFNGCYLKIIQYLKIVFMF